MSEEVIYDIFDEILIIKLNRPNVLNAMNLSVREKILNILKEY
jgi:enoyl-CoA hydratase/carnithine racemase